MDMSLPQINIYNQPTSTPCIQHNFTFQQLKIYSHFTISSTPLKMISPSKIIKLARKWQRLAAIRRKRISMPRDEDTCSTSSMAEKGHFVVYGTDGKRFVLPLKFLNSTIVRELFKLAEEEFGLQSNVPLTLPCDAIFMEYIISLIQRHVTKDLEKALLMSIATSGCSSSSLFTYQEQGNCHPHVIYSF